MLISVMVILLRKYTNMQVLGGVCSSINPGPSGIGFTSVLGHDQPQLKQMYPTFR